VFATLAEFAAMNANQHRNLTKLVLNAQLILPLITPQPLIMDLGEFAMATILFLAKKW